MSVDNLNVGRSHPVWGNMNWTPADLPRSNSIGIPIQENVTVDTLSNVVSPGARGVMLYCQFEVSTATCDVQLYTSISGVDTQVMAWTGVKNGQALFAGQLEHIDLQGVSIKVKLLNISTGWASVYYKTTR